MRTSILAALLFLLSFLSASLLEAQTPGEPNEGCRIIRNETTGD